MNKRVEDVLKEAFQKAGIAEHLVQNLLSECPWLNGDDEIDHNIGAELLETQAAQFHWTAEQVERLLDSYNDQVARLKNPHSELQSEAYAAVLGVLTGFGREDAYGQGDFWLVEDSFSTTTPTIILFGKYVFPDPVFRKLQDVLSAYSSVFKGLRIATEEGDEIAVVSI